MLACLILMIHYNDYEQENNLVASLGHIFNSLPATVNPKREHSVPKLA